MIQNVSLLLLFLSTTFVLNINSDPIVIRSGASKGLEHGEKKGENVFDVKSIKGIANYEGEEGFNRDNESKHVKAQDSGHYNEEDGAKKIHQNENNFADNKFHQQSGGDVADFDKKTSNKKGHHKSGYTKSFHKDETASNSNYYDDSDDEGGEYVHNSKKNSYGDSAQQAQRGAEVDHRKQLQDHAKKGYYDNAGNFQKDLSNQRGYNGQKYYDNRENEGRRNLNNNYGQGDRFEEEKYVQKKPHYQDNYYQEPYYNHRPIAPKKTITIYEDPRYVDRGYDRYPEQQYESDNVHLNFQRPTRDYDYKYYDRRPNYDDYSYY